MDEKKACESSHIERGAAKFNITESIAFESINYTIDKQNTIHIKMHKMHVDCHRNSINHTWLK